jgi:site-specific DNA recombinase
MMEVTKIPKKIVTVIEPKRSISVDKEKYRQKRVAAYCRVSTDSEEQLVSYANQKKVYTEMIGSRKGWCFAGLFADEGKSGTRADKRPEFNKMINACLAGKIDYIITKSVSRFARNTVDCLDYVRMLKSKGIGVYFEEQQIDTLKTDSELYLVIYAGFAQSKSESISKNIIWTVRNKFEEGIPVFMYTRFLGYRKGADGEPEIVPSEAAIVERIFNLYLAGETVDNISKMMRAEHYQIPGKNISFSKGMIMSMLANERYCGDAILQKSVTVDCIEKKRKKNTGEAPMYYVQNSHPAIIDRVTFNKVQEELARRRAKSPASAKATITSTGKYSRYALTDVLICGECGTRYRRVTWSRNGVKRIVWRCISRLDYGKKYCKESPTIFEDKLHEAIVRAVNRFNEQDNATYKALMRATIGEALGLNSDPEEVDMLERKIEALNKKMLALVNESVASGEGIEAHESEFMTLSQELELIKHRIETIQEKATRTSGEQDRLKQIQAIIAEREDHSMEYDDSIVRQMIECIKVYPGGKLEIIFGGGYLVEETV